MCCKIITTARTINPMELKVYPPGHIFQATSRGLGGLLGYLLPGRGPMRRFVMLVSIFSRLGTGAGGAWAVT